VKVLITGGTGYVGSHTTAAVLRRGHEVRLLVRDPSRVPAALEPLGVDLRALEIVTGDVTDAASVAAAVDGVTAVVHLAQVFSMDSRDFPKIRRINVPGTQNVLSAARRAGADPIVFGSSTAALLPSREPLTTDSPPGPAGRSIPAYFASQSAAERIARRHQDEGAPITNVYLVGMLGPHDPHMGDQLTRLRNAVLGRLRFPPKGGFSLNDVRDSAALLAQTLTPGLGPRRYIPAAHYVPTHRYIHTIEDAIGRHLPVVHPPARPARVLCRMTDVVQHVVPWHIPAEYTAAFMCSCEARVSDTLPAAPLGVGARPLSETIGDSIRWLYQQGLLTTRQAGMSASAMLSRQTHPRRVHEYAGSNERNGYR
jgi:dihydroflavonol-4-reductase